MSGKQIKDALDLTVAPKPKERNYSYIMKSESLDNIKKAYKRHNPGTPNDREQDLITEFAISLKHLKQDEWHNSIDDLPEGKILPQENMLLLWKLDNRFTDAFYTHPRTTPKRDSK